ncbi:DUF6134 family protein [uncultured Algibacter sp.]|uniref:DUF6134 family protein n=1 Tax=uncultured Algibacter sp. TaxID=298659 RepID=UPI002622A54E|nr:DUF6134 family protein [uncultured Algibacter sp.]
MRKIILLFLLLICYSLPSQTEDHRFNVIHKGKLLGTLDATKTIIGNKISYQSHTNIEYQLLVAITIVYKYNVTYEKGILKEANAHITVRGKDKTKVRTIWTDEGYKFYSEDELEKELKMTIKHSIIQLVLEEPTGVSKIYAEEHGDFHTIKKIGEHAYLKTAPNGRESKYYYENGVLQKSDVDAGIIKFSIVRRD